MKTLIKIAVLLFSIILFVISAAFIVIEGRLLVSGDWLLYEMPWIGFLQYFCRFLLSCAAAFTAVCGARFIVRKH